ncbi:MAG: 3-phosphoshikimate 1-carboxyvinyltransferase, partial [Kiritimatiellae bacterium]|nr:3-phosphoshikimate 1-carboxyvinyltransferase [Kiritimatiellia bacterium]
FRSFDDHRIAMAIAVGATVADGPVVIDNPDCAAKSYPGFFEEFARLRLN